MDGVCGLECELGVGYPERVLEYQVALRNLGKNQIPLPFAPFRSFEQEFRSLGLLAPIRMIFLEFLYKLRMLLYNRERVSKSST